MNDAPPRLVYAGDVPVEASWHGSALLHRLLADWPAERLMIVECGVTASQPARRLPGVRYLAAPPPFPRLQTTRFAPLYEQARLRLARAGAAALARRFAAFGADAVLTVSHGVSFLAAAAAARDLALPLHMICHDEWARIGAAPAWRERVFGEVWRAAASRLCVSPFMAESYAARFGAPGDVLLPARGADARVFAGPPARLGEPARPFALAFAGTINSPGQVALLRAAASALQEIGGKLLLFGPLDEAAAAQAGLDAPNVERCGALPSNALIETLRERAHALFAPMSFAAADRANMELCFPSKLVDYSAVGLPILIQAPPSASAARWARADREAARLVESDDVAALAAALRALADDPQLRIALARGAVAAGMRDFSHAAARAVFMRATLGAAAANRNAA